MTLGVFDSMLTPKVITAVYWLLLVPVAVLGFNAMFADYEEV